MRHDLPAGHVEQAIAPAREYYSAVSPLQAIGLAVKVGHLDPAGHFVQTLSLVSAYHPEVQGTSALETLGQELPAGHVEQIIAPASEYCCNYDPSHKTGL